MTREELINLVKTKIDEISPRGMAVHTVGESDAKPVLVLADELLDESAREVLLKAPVYRLVTSSMYIIPKIKPDGSGYVLLPNDFIRLVEFKMKEWQRPVNEPVLAGTEIARRQHNKFLRGGICKPVCVLVNREGRLLLEYYSVKESHEVECFEYVKRRAAEDMPVDIQPVVAWFCASKVLEIIGKANEAKAAYESGINLF